MFVWGKCEKKVDAKKIFPALQSKAQGKENVVKSNFPREVWSGKILLCFQAFYEWRGKCENWCTTTCKERHLPSN